MWAFLACALERLKKWDLEGSPALKLGRLGSRPQKQTLVVWFKILNRCYSINVHYRMPTIYLYTNARYRHAAPKTAFPTMLLKTAKTGHLCCHTVGGLKSLCDAISGFREGKHKHCKSVLLYIRWQTVTLPGKSLCELLKENTLSNLDSI